MSKSCFVLPGLCRLLKRWLVDFFWVRRRFRSEFGESNASDWHSD
jgi:hypothetical protein